jgi:hypothetical protein
VPTKNNFGASQQNIANYFSLLWGTLISLRCVRDILSEKKRNGRMKHVKRLKGEKLDNLEDVSVIWMGQVNAKHLAATGEVIKEQTKTAKLDSKWV